MCATPDYRSLASRFNYKIQQSHTIYTHTYTRLCSCYSYNLTFCHISSSMSSSTLQQPSHRNGFSPSRSERTRTLDSTGEFASPPPPITTPMHVNGHASGSRDGSSSITVDPHPRPGPSNGVYNPEPPKPEKKRKKKGWKGWALVVEDDHGNILEINDGPEPDPLPSRRGRVGREVVTAPVASVEPIPPPVVFTSEFHLAPRAAFAWREIMLTYFLQKPRVHHRILMGKRLVGRHRPRWGLLLHRKSLADVSTVDSTSTHFTPSSASIFLQHPPLFTLHHSLTDFSLPSTCYPSYTLDHALHYFTNYTYTCQPPSFTMNQTLSTCRVGSILPVQRQSTRSTRNTNPRYTKFLQPVWKQRKLPVPEPQTQPPGSKSTRSS